MNKELVSISREKFDENTIHGFVLGESENLLLINYVYDFNLDGFMVLRKEDISLLETSKTDIFQTELLKSEGVYEKVNFDSKYNLSSWKEFIESVVIDHKYFIIEEEVYEEPIFTIGTIDQVRKKSLTMKCFSGTGNWVDEPEKIKYADITKLLIGNNYINVYERYFSKQSA